MARETRVIWATRIARWERSRLTATAFAAREGLNAGTLSYWKWKLRRTAPPVPEVAPHSAMSFVEYAAPALGAGHVEVVLPAGYRVCVPTGASGETLRTILDVLEARR